METGALHALFNQNPSQTVKTASLRPGQIINGKIIKLYPDQIAQVQIGSQKMIAQLETPLSANERYWFQVQSGEGKVHLKVIASGADDGKQPDNLTRILGEFSIPPTKENIELVRFFIKEQLPINSEILKQVSGWLKGADQQSAGMEAVKMLLMRGLPLTRAVYSALYTANKEQSLILLMDHLHIALNEGFQGQTETSLKVKGILNEMIPSNKSLVSGQALSQLLSTWFKGQSPESQAAFSLLQQNGAFPGLSDERAVLQLMLAALNGDETGDDELPAEWEMARRILGLIDKGNSSDAKQLINSFISGKETATYLKTSSINDITDSLKLLFARADAPGKQESLLAFKQLLGTLFAGDADESASLEKGISILIGDKANLVNVRVELEKAAGDGLGQLSKMSGLNGRQEDLLARILVQAEQAIASRDPGAAILSSAKLKGFLSALGLTHEQLLAEAFNGPADAKSLPADTLKPYLLRLIGEQPPQAVKEAAEQLMNKITGFQILSQETGPIQQLIVQVPFLLGGKLNELTMQWSGQKTDDGKIDADFCRVLFYLKLENLEDTIVDMQVQNRIMSIQVINDNQLLKKFSAELLPILKENLAKIDYHLSSLNFAGPNSAKQGEESKKLADLYSKKEYSRVDIKI